MDKFKRGQIGLILAIIGILVVAGYLLYRGSVDDCNLTPHGPLCVFPQPTPVANGTLPSSNGQTQNQQPAQPPSSNNPANLMYKVTSTAPSTETCSPIGGQVVCNNGLVVINSCCLNAYNTKLDDAQRQQVCDFAAGTGKPIAPCIDAGKSSWYCQISDGKLDIASNNGQPLEDAVDCPITQPGSQSDVAVTVPTEEWNYHDGLSFDFYKTKNDGDFILNSGGQTQVVTNKVVQVGEVDSIPIEVHNYNDAISGTIKPLASDCFQLTYKTIDPQTQLWPLSVDHLQSKSLDLVRVKNDYCPSTVIVLIDSLPGGEKSVKIDFTKLS